MELVRPWSASSRMATASATPRLLAKSRSRRSRSGERRRWKRLDGLTSSLLFSEPPTKPSSRRPFFETLVQLIIGVLFISISATVTPQSLRHLLLPTLALVAVLVLVARPHRLGS